MGNNQRRENIHLQKKKNISDPNKKKKIKKKTDMSNCPYHIPLRRKRDENNQLAVTCFPIKK